MITRYILIGVSALSLGDAGPSLAQVTSQSDDQSAVTATAIEAAKSRLNGSTSLADKMAQAASKSNDVQAALRTRATALAGETTAMSAEQLRARFAGNAQVAKSEATPCDTPPAEPAKDDPGICAPGHGER